jgi:hypothetical protein
MVPAYVFQIDRIGVWFIHKLTKYLTLGLYLKIWCIQESGLIMVLFKQESGLLMVLFKQESGLLMVLFKPEPSIN